MKKKSGSLIKFTIPIPELNKIYFKNKSKTMLMPKLISGS